MGLEIKTLGQVQSASGTLREEGRLHLDSKSLTFRSKAFKCSIDLVPTPQVHAEDESLVIERGDERFEFHIPQDVERWLRKIQHPPTRVEKLAVKSGMACWLSRGFKKDFQNELRANGAKVIRNVTQCDLAFAFVPTRELLSELQPVCESLPAKVNVWVVWPKGCQEISQSDVMQFMGQLGFGPSKTAAFDEGLSSMRYAKKSDGR